MDISAVCTKGEDISSQHTVKFAQVLFFFVVENEPLHPPPLQKKVIQTAFVPSHITVVHKRLPES